MLGGLLLPSGLAAWLLQCGRFSSATRTCCQPRWTSGKLMAHVWAGAPALPLWKALTDEPRVSINGLLVLVAIHRKRLRDFFKNKTFCLRQMCLLGSSLYRVAKRLFFLQVWTKQSDSQMGCAAPGVVGPVGCDPDSSGSEPAGGGCRRPVPGRAGAVGRFSPGEQWPRVRTLRVCSHLKPGFLPRGC